MLRDEHIICIAPEVWNASWLDVHRYMQLLARHNRVLFVERPITPLSFIVPDQKELAYPQIKYWLQDSIREVETNLYVGTPPPALPLRFETPILRFNQFIRGRWIQHVMKKLKFQKPILWIYDSDAAPLLGMFDEKFSLYTITDDYAYNSFYHNNSQQILKWDSLLISKVDLVLACAINLADVKRPLNPNTHYVAHGVEYELFSQALYEDLNIATELEDIAMPVVGFIGRVDKPIDVAIVEAIHDRHPEWQLVFVGSVGTSEAAQKLRQLERLQLVGLQPVTELPRFLKKMSVCIIPYEHQASTQYVHPLKALEYLAAGKPVVSTPLPSLSVHKDYLYFAAEPLPFVEAIERALIEDTPHRQQQRNIYTRDKTWAHQLDKTSQLILQTMAKRKTGSYEY